MFANKVGSKENGACGLVWVNPETHKSTPVPLRSVSVTASVVHAVAQVEITQVYVNPENNPIEASYIFPVDSNGAVTHFHAKLNGKIIKGVVKSKADARKDYDTAILNQQTAFLGEEVDADIFKLKVGFLKPGEEAKVVIGYVTEVKNDPDSHAIRFVIPTTVAPRYVPASSSNDQRSKDLANMTFSGSAPAPMDIKVVVSIQGEIKSVKSLSDHKILVEDKGVIPGQSGNWNKAVVTLAGNVTEMDRDFILLVTPADAVMNPRVYYETLENGSVAAMAHLIPSFALKEEKVELIIVVDRSLSMSGQSIRMASAALQLFIRSLPPDCYFNIIGFGSIHEFLFTEASRKYNQESLHEAHQYAKRLEANFGGTEILTPLKEIYCKPEIPGYFRQIFVITDGEVSNTDEVIGLVKRNAGNSRLFSLGIGASSSRHLVQGMATAGGGTCAFVEGDDSIEKATLSQLKNALQPSLSEIQVEWLGLPVAPRVEMNTEKTLFGYNKPLNPENSSESKLEKFLQSPKNVPPIFDGNQMVVFGIFPLALGQPTGLKITAVSPDGPLTLEIQMNENNSLGKTQMLHKLAVIRLIREMEMEEAAMRYSTSLQEQIVALGVEHGVTSKYTSFIAVDDSNKEAICHSQMMIRHIPSQFPAGYGASVKSLPSLTMKGGRGRINDCYDDFLFDACSTMSIPSRGRGRAKGRSHRSPVRGSECSMDSVPLRGRARSRSSSPVLDPPAITAQRVREIINEEQFNGSFLLTETLCRILGISYEDVKSEASNRGWDPTLWATALTIACLTTTELKEEKDLWELAVNKAEKWMTQNCPNDANTLHEIRLQAMQFCKIMKN